jgi:hypothetical protein
VGAPGTDTRLGYGTLFGDIGQCFGEGVVYSGSGGEPGLEIGIYPRVFPWRKVKTALV